MRRKRRRKRRRREGMRKRRRKRMRKRMTKAMREVMREWMRKRMRKRIRRKRTRERMRKRMTRGAATLSRPEQDLSSARVRGHRLHLLRPRLRRVRFPRRGLGTRSGATRQSHAHERVRQRKTLERVPEQNIRARVRAQHKSVCQSKT
eukprot:3673537-Rhodomonas_salina.1